MNGCSFMALPHIEAFKNALLDRDVSAAWMIWSSASEGALADAFDSAGGSSPC